MPATGPCSAHTCGAASRPQPVRDTWDRPSSCCDRPHRRVVSLGRQDRLTFHRYRPPRQLASVRVRSCRHGTQPVEDRGKVDNFGRVSCPDERSAASLPGHPRHLGWAYQQRQFAGARAVGIEYVGIQRPRRRAPSRHVGSPWRLLQPLRQPDRPAVRARNRRTRGGRSSIGVRVRHGCDRCHGVGALFDRQPHCGSAPALCRHTRVPAGSVPALRHRRHVRRRCDARSVQ